MLACLLDCLGTSKGFVVWITPEGNTSAIGIIFFGPNRASNVGDITLDVYFQIVGEEVSAGFFLRPMAL